MEKPCGSWLSCIQLFKKYKKQNWKLKVDALNATPNNSEILNKIFCVKCCITLYGLLWLLLLLYWKKNKTQELNTKKITLRDAWKTEKRSHALFSIFPARKKIACLPWPLLLPPLCVPLASSQSARKLWSTLANFLWTLPLEPRLDSIGSLGTTTKNL